MSQTWFFYMVRCRDNSLYCGITTDISSRVERHNQGKGSKYVSSRRPVELVHIEEWTDESRVKKREAEVKSWPKSRKEKLISREVDG